MTFEIAPTLRLSPTTQRALLKGQITGSLATINALILLFDLWLLVRPIS